MFSHVYLEYIRMPDASGREYESYELDLLLQRRYFIQIVALKSIDDLDGFIASSAKPPWIWYHRAGRIYTGPIHDILRGERRVKLPLSSPSRETRDIVSNTSWKYVIILVVGDIVTCQKWMDKSRFFSGSIPAITYCENLQWIQLS